MGENGDTFTINVWCFCWTPPVILVLKFNIWRKRKKRNCARTIPIKTCIYHLQIQDTFFESVITVRLISSPLFVCCCFFLVSSLLDVYFFNPFCQIDAGFKVSTETIRLIRDREKGVWRWGRGRWYTYHYTVTTRMTSALKDKSKVRGDFDTISVKACRERWCRWNCDLRVINAWKKAFSVVPKASPWCPNHVTICLLRHSGESLQNGQLKLQRWNWYFARETHKDIAVSVWACQAGFWKSTSIPWGLRNRTHWSARYTNGRDAAQQESQLIWTV